MKVLYGVWIFIQFLLALYFVLPLLLWLAYKLFGRPYTPLLPAGDSRVLPDYAVIITAYQHPDQVPAAVHSILRSHYSRFIIYVVADNIAPTPQLLFQDERVVVLYPETVLAGNTRSHFYAIRHFIRPHTHLTIVDSDNLVHPDMLSAFNPWFARGFQAVQGLREPKNLEGTYARLDAARDIYYHFYDGKLLFGLGSSATLAGSGMAFTTALYRDCLEHHPISGAGFDKVLQYQILSRSHRIAFEPEAIIYDEKTAATDQLVNQRARWINTWFRYFGYGFRLMALGISRLQWNPILFGLILLRPPLFIFLILGIGCLLVNLVVAPAVSLLWILAFLIFVIGFGLALSGSPTDPRIYHSLKSIPAFMFYQVKSLLVSRQANKRSVATVHKPMEKMDSREEATP